MNSSRVGYPGVGDAFVELEGPEAVMGRDRRGRCQEKGDSASIDGIIGEWINSSRGIARCRCRLPRVSGARTAGAPS